MPNIDKINYKGTEYDLTPADYDSKANVDGYYETFTSGQTNQLIATEAIIDTEPYTYRKTGGPNDVGDRVYDTLVGGSVVWNQLFAREKATTFRDNYVTYSDGVYTVSFAEGSTMSSNVLVIPVENFNSEHVYYTFFKIVDDTNYGEMRFQFPNGSGNTTSKATLEGISARGGMVRKGGTYTNFVVSKTAAYATQQSISFRVLCFDLTAALGSAIADYVYSLETATAGAGVAWVRKYFPKEYYAYAEPHFEHVQTSAKCTVGFNQFDEIWESGYYDTTNGSPASSTTWQRNKNPVPCLPNTQYNVTQESGGTFGHILFCGIDGSYISSVNAASVASVNFTLITPANAYQIKFYRSATNNGKWLNVNFKGDRDGEYEPYRKRTYPIEPKVLRGYPTLDASNKLCFVGDTYTHDGTITRKRHLVDLGTLNYVRIQVNGVYVFRTYSQGKHGIIPGYVSGTLTALGDKEFVSSTSYWDSTLRLAIRNDAYTTAADFKTAMSGVYIEADLAEPTTETAEPFQSPMVVDPLGTEEFVDYGVTEGDRDVAIPVGHNSEYPADLRGKLQHLPSLASADGRYCVQQSGKQMSLVADTSPGRLNVLENKIPDPPTTEGNYQLTCSINSVGSPTFSWVAASNE